MKSLLKILIVITFIGFSCTKEDPIPVSASFTTSMPANNTIETGEGFTVYLYDASGEFLTYYKGNTDANTYKPDRALNEGISISADTDSVEITGYRAAGTYTFAVLAASSGNWSEDYIYDVDSISITVVEP